jgi:predicted ABC-type ATPase
MTNSNDTNPLKNADYGAVLMKKRLYLIAGANGSGKTTLAHELLREEQGLVFLNADETAAKIGDSAGISAGRTILTDTAKMLADGKSFVIESTISGKYHRRVLDEARGRGYEIILIYVFLDALELNIARIKNRVRLGGHNVPEADVVRRFYRSVKNFGNVATLVDFWKLYYNGVDGLEQIANGCGDDVEVLNDGLYEKFTKGLSRE